MLNDSIRERVNEYCTTNGLSLSQFIRNAILEKLETPTQVPHVKVEPIDTKTIDLALEQLNDKISRLEKSIEYLIERDTLEHAKTDEKIIEAKELLLKEQPKTYEEANKIVEDINTMTEAINQLLGEKKVLFKRRQFVWK